MTTRLSNGLYMGVLQPVGLEGVGWYARVLSERDWASQVAVVERFVGLGFTKGVSDAGGGMITLDADDRLFTDALPVGEVTRIQDQGALWQIMENGVVRSEFLAEDLKEDIVHPESGLRVTEISGRGIGAVLDWAKVLPEGMPVPAKTQREFKGVHPMQAWLTLLTEAQAAGFLPFVTVSFDAVADSQGNAWQEQVDLSVNAGDSLLDLLTRWCEAYGLVWKMHSGFILEVRPESASRHLEGEIVFTAYRDQTEHSRLVSRREIANVVYAETSVPSADPDAPDGIVVAQATDGPSQAKWHKRALWLTAGDSGGASAASAVANATLGLQKDEKQSRTIKIDPYMPGRKPFEDFDVNDWVAVELEEGASDSVARRVMALSVELDEDGNPNVEVTLQSRFENRQVKLQKMLDKLGGSSSSSDAATPIPAASQLAATKLGDLSDVDVTGAVAGRILSHNGAKWIDETANLNFLTDVDLTVPPTDGQTLVFNAATGLWKAATPAAGGASSHAWETVLDLPGTTFSTSTDWTVVAGSWSSNGTEIVQATTSGTTRAYLKKKVLPGAIIVDVEIMVTASTGSDTQAGVVIGSPGGTQTGATLYRLHMNNSTADTFQIEQDATLARFASPGNWGGLNVWKKLRCVQFASSASIYLDGVLLGTAANAIASSPIGDSTYVGFKTNTASIKIRNLKVWNPKMPALL